MLPHINRHSAVRYIFCPDSSQLLTSLYPRIDCLKEMNADVCICNKFTQSLCMVLFFFRSRSTLSRYDHTHIITFVSVSPLKLCVCVPFFHSFHFAVILFFIELAQGRPHVERTSFYLILLPHFSFLVSTLKLY